MKNRQEAPDAAAVEKSNRRYAHRHLRLSALTFIAAIACLAQLAVMPVAEVDHLIAGVPESETTEIATTHQVAASLEEPSEYYVCSTDVEVETKGEEVFRSAITLLTGDKPEKAAVEEPVGVIEEVTPVAAETVESVESVAGAVIADILPTVPQPVIETQPVTAAPVVETQPVWTVAADTTGDVGAYYYEETTAAPVTEPVTVPVAEPVTAAPVVEAIPATEPIPAASYTDSVAAALVASVTAANGSVVLNTLGVPMSDMAMPSHIQLDANGRPTNYKSVMTGYSTAYCTGSYTATGTVPQQGSVAVNPNIIPYGTEMWIVSADGRYVYGYCKAEDTGGFIYSPNAAIADVYMHSYDDCIQWGNRDIIVYIF